MRSITIWEVSEEAKEKGLPETVADSSISPAKSSGMAAEEPLEVGQPLRVLASERWPGGGAMALETSKAETLQERERNSIGSLGVSGGRNRDEWTGSDRHGSAAILSIAFVQLGVVYGGGAQV